MLISSKGGVGPKGLRALGTLDIMPRTWSLITVTYNSATPIRTYWADERPDDVEWIVVDNGSSDDSVAAATALGATVLATEQNLGFSAANNLGLEAATGQYIAFVNPDVRVDYTDLDRLADTIDVVGGLVSPQLLNMDGTLQPNGRGAPLLLHKVLNRLSRADRRNGYRLFADPDERRNVFWLIGAVVAGSQSTVRSLGGWNERFFLYYEDKDLSIRAWRAGHPVTVLGEMRWTHGWARETTRFHLVPWAREVDSLLRFYSLYPEFLFGGALARRRHTTAFERTGKLVIGG